MTEASTPSLLPLFRTGQLPELWLDNAYRIFDIAYKADPSEDVVVLPNGDIATTTSITHTDVQVSIHDIASRIRGATSQDLPYGEYNHLITFATDRILSAIEKLDFFGAYEPQPAEVAGRPPPTALRLHLHSRYYITGTDADPPPEVPSGFINRAVIVVGFGRDCVQVRLGGTEYRTVSLHRHTVYTYSYETERLTARLQFPLAYMHLIALVPSHLQDSFDPLFKDTDSDLALTRYPESRRGIVFQTDMPGCRVASEELRRRHHLSGRGQTLFLERGSTSSVIGLGIRPAHIRHKCLNVPKALTFSRRMNDLDSRKWISGHLVHGKSSTILTLFSNMIGPGVYGPLSKHRQAQGMLQGGSVRH
ncbi:hypothetical protein BV25DRAFT_1837435 [Artomyces pyxidatus]|uniref:Uncharacterized protein n=1 Tax=Artomyces pyxidatus TaxID=48021 RepID=A0ACB8T7A9_9AGAM|nr:hypothetical protein BV25DRAFT_1837435 [Artomyces pyxidatus]